MATDHDSIDHGYAAKAHPAIHLDAARLSWQRSRDQKPPAPWKIGIVVMVVLGVLGLLNFLQEMRVRTHMTHMEDEIRNNIVTLATAAYHYMQVQKVNRVNEPDLVGPKALLKEAPSSILGENYRHIVFSRDDPDNPFVIEIRVPNGPKLFFRIRWKDYGNPNFVSQPVPVETN